MHKLEYGVKRSLSKEVYNVLRKNKKKYLALASLVLISAVGSILYKKSDAYVSPIMRYDINNDGKKDGIVAFPIPFTEKAIIRSIDGKDLEEKGYRDNLFLPNYLEVNFFSTSHIKNVKQHIVPKSYNNPPLSMRLLGKMAITQSDLEIILDEFNSNSSNFYLSE